MGNAQAVSAKCCHCKEYGMFFCYDCKKVLCGTCRKDHDKHTSINRHFVIENKYVNHQILKTDLNCNQHETSFSLYCSSCDVLICNECVTTSHFQHIFSDIATTVKKAEDDFRAVQLNLQEKRKILLSNETKIKSQMIPALNTKKESVQQEIRNSVCKLQKTIEDVKEVTENFKEEIYIQELNKLTTTMKEIERIDNVYSSTLQLIKTTLSEKHHIGFLMFYQSLKADVHSLEDIIETVDDVDIPAFDNQDFTHKVVNSMLLDLNESKIQDRDNALKDLQEQVKLLTQQIQCLQTTRTNNNITIKNLESENQQLKSMQMTATKSNITMKTLESENRQLKSVLQQTKASSQDIENGLRQKINDLQTQLNMAIQDNREIQNWKINAEEFVHDLESGIQNKNREIKNWQIYGEKTRGELESKQQRIRQIEVEKGSLARENAGLKEKIRSLQRIDVNRMPLPEQRPVSSYQQLPRESEMSLSSRQKVLYNPERYNAQLPTLPKESETLLSQRRPTSYGLGRYNTHYGSFS